MPLYVVLVDATGVELRAGGAGIAFEVFSFRKSFLLLRSASWRCIDLDDLFLSPWYVVLVEKDWAELVL